MAAITGSTTTAWSSVSLGQVDFAANFVNAGPRLSQIMLQFRTAQFAVASAGSTRLVVDMFSGGRLTLVGSRLTTRTPLIREIDFRNPPDGSGEVIRAVGTFNGGIETLTAVTLGSPGFSETMNGTIQLIAASGNYTGTLTSLAARIGSTTVTFNGRFRLSGNMSAADITGTVTAIAVVNGGSAITMTGLSLPWDDVEAALANDTLTTVHDLFTYIGNRMTGNDAIIYTNNSGAGMSFHGGPGNDTIIIGGPHGDTLNGGDGDDVLDGGPGQDTIVGGDGNDRITMLITPGDTDTINAGPGFDTLILAGTVPGNGEVVVNLSLSDQVVSIGGAADGLVQANFEHLDASRVVGSVNVTGNSLDNTLIGSPGNDVLNGGTGNDTMIGGLGDDTYRVDSPGDIVREGRNAGIDKVFSPIDYTLGANLENLELTGGALIGRGNELNNVITGNGGPNTLYGMAGNDTLNGGAGDDTLIGGPGNDTLVGGAGNDTLIGGPGNDTLVGGSGNDTYVIGEGTDELIEQSGEGIDLVQSSITHALGPNFENLTLTGTKPINGRGNELNNVVIGNGAANVLEGGAGNDTLIGNGGNDRLDGGLGADRMEGGAGNDTYIVDSASDQVIETVAGSAGGVDLVVSSVSFTLGPNVEHLTLIGTANLNGTGNELNNVLIGNSGNNTLNGGSGADRMEGGAGDDTYIVDHVGDRVIETVAGSAGGVDLVVSSVSFTLGPNVEHLTLTGTANINGTGNGLDNILTGNSGNNVLLGLAGNDTLHGGDGDDVLDGGPGQDIVNGGGGNDRITMLVTAGNVDTINAGPGIDTLILTGAVAGNGEVVVNLSSTSDHVVSIGGVAETLVQIGFENLDASSITGYVTVTGSGGDNHIIGSNGHDRLMGGAGNDTLIGGAGNDILGGGSGNDLLISGAGNDIYLFGRGDGQDVIQDSSGTADRLQFNSGVNPLDLILSRQADDLRVAIRGTSDHVTVQHWYRSASNRVDILQAGNGQVLLSGQVQQLINAMAQFTTDTGLSWEAAAGGSGTTQQQAQFQGILAANWQSAGV
ncbi:calcium-binding protein [Candidatus Nitrospira inopinata]|jgi:Ca2+-binding RTX toxin-like protein|uniref:Hemolysin-type calcium binding domain protein n=1 Tax=Candidatus Nitrospira inopinata TaxID=1715989 RepID=A0A0S4KUW3_9BACT|nr:calcium-binding protein [Candidatus Nitrospira inopinata]CUQ68183.1 Hemolysin-type calcium binding domain protein [Candidatus Nitrospira inopinata]